MQGFWGFGVLDESCSVQTDPGMPLNFNQKIDRQFLAYVHPLGGPLIPGQGRKGTLMSNPKPKTATRAACFVLTLFLLWAPAAWAAERPTFDWIETAWSRIVAPLQELASDFGSIFRIVMEETSTEETGVNNPAESTPIEPTPEPPTVMIGGGIEPIG